MRFEINMRDGSTFEVEASYIEVVDGPVSSTYTLIGPVPGYPSAIMATFPVEQTRCLIPAPLVTTARRRRRDSADEST